MKRPRPSCLWVMPPSIMTRVVFADQYVCDAGATTVSVTTFRGNSVYDPQYAVGGGTPSLFAQWSAFYRKYKVIAAEIGIEALNSDAARMIVGILARRPDVAAVTTGTGAQQQMLEGPDSVHALMVADTIQVSPVCLGMYRTTKEMIPADYASNTLTALINADPATVWYYDVVLINSDSVSEGATATVTVRIQYFVEMFEYASTITD